MRYFIYVDAVGFVASASNGIGDPPDLPGMTVSEVQGPVQIFGGPKGSRLRASDMQWVDPRSGQQQLADAKAAKNTEINIARAAANSSYFTFDGKQIAVDDLSMKDIQSANGIIALTGALPGGWPGAWKAIDNTYVLIPDIATWMQFYGAMVATGTANFTYSQALKATLAAATTVAEVDGITWSPT